jgi:hypothetical protein
MLALSPTSAIGCGTSTKLNQPSLCRIQGQPKIDQKAALSRFTIQFM